MNIISKVVLAMSVFITTTVATNISPAYAIQTFSKRMHKAVDNFKETKTRWGIRVRKTNAI